MKKYMPSKKFIYLLGSFIVIAFVFFVAFKLFSNKDNFLASKNTGRLGVDKLALAGLTVDELIKKDSDGDGIPDWEEALWGTDKNNAMTFAGLTDSAYIANKKKELNIDETKNEEGLTETEKFAREFFTVYVAMKASGNIDATAINNFSNTLGQKIVTPSLIDQYSLKDIKTSNNNTPEEKVKYYESIQKKFENYKTQGIGDELSIIDNQLFAPIQKESQEKLKSIAEAYQEFANDAIKIIVPSSLSNEHLKIINSANNVGKSVLNMTKIESDPIVGLSGISQYQKDSEDLINAVADLETKIQ